MREPSDYELLLEEAREQQRYAAGEWASLREAIDVQKRQRYALDPDAWDNVAREYALARALYRAAMTARKLAEGHVLVAPEAERYWSAVDCHGCDEWFTGGARWAAEEEAFAEWDADDRPPDRPPLVNEYALVATHEVGGDGEI